jgi:hypothetical protein
MFECLFRSGDGEVCWKHRTISDRFFNGSVCKFVVEAALLRPDVDIHDVGEPNRVCLAFKVKAT